MTAIPRVGRSKPRRSPLCAVLCDDHRMFIESLELALTRRGHRVLGALVVPAEAADLAITEHADVCVMDLSFGKSDSVDAIRALDHRGPRIVVLTGYLDDVVRERCLEAGADACASKDLPLEDVLAVIEGPAYRHNQSTTAQVRVMGLDPWSAHPLARFLTIRERQVLAALVVGETTEGLTKRLGVSQATVRSHIQAILAKLGLHSRLEAVAFAVRNSLVAPAQMERRGGAAV